MKKILHTISLLLMATVLNSSCGVYSFTGVSTTAKNISVQEFYNNAHLGPANMGQTFTNSLKTYFIQNSSLAVVPEEGELQLEGEITDFKLSQISPTVTANSSTQGTTATSTRITITIKATFVDSNDDKLCFKNKTFSFYKDFTNDSTLSDVQEQFVKDIFEQIIKDIFNATVANW